MVRYFIEYLLLGFVHLMIRLEPSSFGKEDHRVKGTHYQDDLSLLVSGRQDRLIAGTYIIGARYSPQLFI